MLIIKVKYLEAFIATKMTSMLIWFMDMPLFQEIRANLVIMNVQQRCRRISLITQRRMQFIKKFKLPGLTHNKKIC